MISLFSIFLCGIVVTYVGTTNNYKEMYDAKASSERSLLKKVDGLEQQINDSKIAMEDLEDELNGIIDSLQAEKGSLETKLRNSERELISLREKVQNLASDALRFDQTVANMEQSLKQARSELDITRGDEIKLRKNLNEITASLEEKIVQLESLDTEKRRLLEEKAKLEEQIQKLAGAGKVAEKVEVITPEAPDFAKAAMPIASDVLLGGLITAVDNSLATISIGTADGVKEGMVFHVIRNDEFVCDILITDVDAETAAGSLQLIQQMPKVGDKVSTKFD